MKTFITLLLALILTSGLLAQNSGLIKYAVTTKIEIAGIEGIDLGDMMPTSMDTNKDLYFDDMVTVYKDAADNVTEDIEMESDDGSFQMVIGQSSSEEILYTDLKNKTIINQTAFMSKEFLIEEKLEKLKWKLTTEKIKYLGYVCQKATAVQTVDPMHGTEEEPTERSIVAWFTSEIPAPIGPRSFNQLPGAVLMVSIDDGKTEIKATEVSLEAQGDDVLQKPTKGKKVTSEEYEKIIAEKMKEMAEMHGGRGSSIIIRG